MLLDTGLALPSEVTVSLKSIKHNLSVIRDKVGPNVKICTMLKGQCYGMGHLKEITNLVCNHEAKVFCIGVCDNNEIKAIREEDKNITIMRGRPASAEEIEEVIDLDVEEMVTSKDMMVILNELAMIVNRVIKVHVKVDVGSGRMCFFENSFKDIDSIQELPNLKLVGVMTHFPNSADLETTRQQIKKFNKIVEGFRASGLVKPHTLIHCANSAATLLLPESHMDMVRVGGAIYGHETTGDQTNNSVIPAYQFSTKIINIADVPASSTIGYDSTYTTTKKTVIATLACGYYNGVPRALSNKGWVLVNGTKCPIVGRVSMNVITVDVSATDVNVGDKVFFFGGDVSNRSGPASIFAEDWASWTDGSLNNYEAAMDVAQSPANTNTLFKLDDDVLRRWL